MWARRSGNARTGRRRTPSQRLSGGVGARVGARMTGNKRPPSHPDPEDLAVTTASEAPIAYSYVRFSTAEQGKGTSLRRQVEAAARWCAAHGVHLNASRTYLDLGRSAFLGEHRTNPDRQALAAFLLLAQRGVVPRGSYLIIEALDRLTREHVQAGLRLCLELLERGIRIVQVSPVETVYDDHSDALALVMMLMELNRGHAESQRKSDLMGPAWARKRERARQDGSLMTRRLPAWIEVRDGRLRLVPERAAALRVIYTLSAKGYGHLRIIRELTRRGIAPFGARAPRGEEGGKERYRAAGGTYGAGLWDRTYIAQILRDRRPVGEYQPRRHRVAEGPPIPGYFPAAVSEELWRDARAGAARRRGLTWRPKRDYAELFTGLVRDAKGGGNYFGCTRAVNRHHVRHLVNRAGTNGQTPTRSFPVSTFEQGMLAALREVEPGELLPGDGNAEAREVWLAVRGLMNALGEAADPVDARLRLRAALRRVVERIYLLVAGAGRGRVAVAQVFFHGSTRSRLVHMLHRPRWSCRHRRVQPGRWWAYSCAVPAPGGPDLRQPDDVARLEAGLAERVLRAVAAEAARHDALEAARSLGGLQSEPTAAALAAEVARLQQRRETVRALARDGALTRKGLRRQRDRLRAAEAALEALRARAEASEAKEKRRPAEGGAAPVDPSRGVGRLLTGEAREEAYPLGP